MIKELTVADVLNTPADGDDDEVMTPTRAEFMDALMVLLDNRNLPIDQIGVLAESTRGKGFAEVMERRAIVADALGGFVDGASWRELAKCRRSGVSMACQLVASELMKDKGMFIPEREEV